MFYNIKSTPAILPICPHPLPLPHPSHYTFSNHLTSRENLLTRKPERSHDLSGGNIKSDEENNLHYTKYPDILT